MNKFLLKFKLNQWGAKKKDISASYEKKIK